MSRLIYEYDEDTYLLHIKLQGISNHELRCILLGLWRRLDKVDQDEFIHELRWYLNGEDAELPPLAQAIVSQSEHEE